MLWMDGARGREDYRSAGGGSGRLSPLSGLDEKAVFERPAAENRSDQMRRVELVPTLLGGLGELERQGQGGGS